MIPGKIQNVNIGSMAFDNCRDKPRQHLTTVGNDLDRCVFCRKNLKKIFRHEKIFVGHELDKFQFFSKFVGIFPDRHFNFEIFRDSILKFVGSN